MQVSATLTIISTPPSTSPSRPYLMRTWKKRRGISSARMRHMMFHGRKPWLPLMRWRRSVTSTTAITLPSAVGNCRMSRFGR